MDRQFYQVHENSDGFHILGDNIVLNRYNFPSLYRHMNNPNTNVRKLIVNARKITIDMPLIFDSTNLEFIAENIDFTKRTNIYFSENNENKNKIKLIAKNIDLSNTRGTWGFNKIFSNNINSLDILAGNITIPQGDHNISTFITHNLSEYNEMELSINRNQEDLKTKVYKSSKWLIYTVNRLKHYFLRYPYNAKVQKEILSSINSLPLDYINENIDDANLIYSLKNIKNNIESDLNYFGKDRWFVPTFNFEEYLSEYNRQNNQLFGNDGLVKVWDDIFVDFIINNKPLPDTQIRKYIESINNNFAKKERIEQQIIENNIIISSNQTMIEQLKSTLSSQRLAVMEYEKAKIEKKKLEEQISSIGSTVVGVGVGIATGNPQVGMATANILSTATNPNLTGRQRSFALVGQAANIAISENTGNQRLANQTSNLIGSIGEKDYTKAANNLLMMYSDKQGDSDSKANKALQEYLLRQNTSSSYGKNASISDQNYINDTTKLLEGMENSSNSEKIKNIRSCIESGNKLIEDSKPNPDEIEAEAKVKTEQNRDVIALKQELEKIIHENSLVLQNKQKKLTEEVEKLLTSIYTQKAKLAMILSLNLQNEESKNEFISNYYDFQLSLVESLDRQIDMMKRSFLYMADDINVLNNMNFEKPIIELLKPISNSSSFSKQTTKQFEQTINNNRQNLQRYYKTIGLRMSQLLQKSKEESISRSLDVQRISISSKSTGYRKEFLELINNEIDRVVKLKKITSENTIVKSKLIPIPIQSINNKSTKKKKHIISAITGLEFVDESHLNIGNKIISFDILSLSSGEFVKDNKCYFINFNSDGKLATNSTLNQFSSNMDTKNNKSILEALNITKTKLSLVDNGYLFKSPMYKTYFLQFKVDGDKSIINWDNNQTMPKLESLDISIIGY
jgi:hypothetical protein